MAFRLCNSGPTTAMSIRMGADGLLYGSMAHLSETLMTTFGDELRDLAEGLFGHWSTAETAWERDAENCEQLARDTTGLTAAEAREYRRECSKIYIEVWSVLERRRGGAVLQSFDLCDYAVLMDRSAGPDARLNAARRLKLLGRDDTSEYSVVRAESRPLLASLQALAVLDWQVGWFPGGA
jgi:hypothetical protein